VKGLIQENPEILDGVIEFIENFDADEHFVESETEEQNLSVDDYSPKQEISRVQSLKKKTVPKPKFVKKLVLESDDENDTGHLEILAQRYGVHIDFNDSYGKKAAKSQIATRAMQWFFRILDVKAKQQGNLVNIVKTATGFEHDSVRWYKLSMLYGAYDFDAAKSI